MSMNKGPTLLDGDLPEQENVLQRVLQLPVVSGTCECFQKTYNSTKEAHPLVASVCNAYEKGERAQRGNSPAHPSRLPGWCGTHRAEDSAEHHLGGDMGTCGCAGHGGKDPTPHTSPGCLLHQREGHVPIRCPEGCYG
ncbi:perilipin, isoform CRA_c [Rattus norvegicus]|uniref:Perilipin, isoform CRA_c n=1 Tax=Rattus norvegicus TaxID=10116 RepID=A6JC67_RAT|nr:perilipin, isoform CRA_c [Rattus norvegicus]